MSDEEIIYRCAKCGRGCGRLEELCKSCDRETSNKPRPRFDRLQLAGIGLVGLTPQWIEEKRMDTFSRAITSYREDINEIDYATWCVNEFDKFFETGLAKEEDVQEPEVSEVKYKILLEKENKDKITDLWTFEGLIVVTTPDGKQTIVNDLPIKAQGIDYKVAQKNFITEGNEIIEQLKLEGRFE